jgi:hypothetical protein
MLSLSFRRLPRTLGAARFFRQPQMQSVECEQSVFVLHRTIAVAKSPLHLLTFEGGFECNGLIATVMKLRRIICIAGRLANRGDSNAQILTFALRDCYHYAVIGPINIR